MTHTVCPSLPQRATGLFVSMVEVLGRRRETVIVELHGLEPVVGAALILIQAVLDHWLQRLDGGLHAGEAAFGAVEPRR